MVFVSISVGADQTRLNQIFVVTDAETSLLVTILNGQFAIESGRI